MYIGRLICLITCMFMMFFTKVMSSNEVSIFFNNLIVKEKVKEYFQQEEYLFETKLCKIMNSCGSDKGIGWHNYTSLYAKLFDDFNDEVLNIFEMGIGSTDPNILYNMGSHGIPGASLFGWSEYFHQSKIFGADIDKEIIFETARIQTFFCDQCDLKCINEMFFDPLLINVEFDVIIDDGLHEFYANKFFLENSLRKLKKGGVYIVEDLNNKTKESFSKIILSLKNKFHLNYIDIFSIPHESNEIDNCVLIIQK